MKLKTFVEDLKVSIEQNNPDYNYILSAINFTFGSEFIQKYMVGALKKESVIDLLKFQDNYFNSEKALTYIDNFFKYVDDNLKTNVYICSECQTEHHLTAKEVIEDSTCENEDCNGVLVLSTNNNGGVKVNEVIQPVL